VCSTVWEFKQFKYIEPVDVGLFTFSGERTRAIGIMVNP